jgi:hypothetical protein
VYVAENILGYYGSNRQALNDGLKIKYNANLDDLSRDSDPNLVAETNEDMETGVC